MGWPHGGQWPYGPVPLQSLLNPLGFEDIIQVGLCPQPPCRGFPTFCVTRHSDLSGPSCHDCVFALRPLSRMFFLPFSKPHHHVFAQLIVSRPLGLSFNHTCSGKASLVPCGIKLPCHPCFPTLCACFLGSGYISVHSLLWALSLLEFLAPSSYSVNTRQVSE